MIEHATIIEEIKTDKVGVGTTIKIEYIEDKEVETYSIVGSKEADPFENKISNESPLGHALIGHEIGDEVEVEMGETVSKYKVLDIKKKK